MGNLRFFLSLRANYNTRNKLHGVLQTHLEREYLIGVFVKPFPPHTHTHI